MRGTALELRPNYRTLFSIHYKILLRHSSVLQQQNYKIRPFFNLKTQNSNIFLAQAPVLDFPFYSLNFLANMSLQGDGIYLSILTDNHIQLSRNNTVADAYKITLHYVEVFVRNFPSNRKSRQSVVLMFLFWFSNRLTITHMEISDKKP